MSWPTSGPRFGRDRAAASGTGDVRARAQGRAALDAAIEQARALGETITVLNTSRGERQVDPTFASDDDLAGVRRVLDEAGVTYDVQQSVSGKDVADEIVETAEARKARLIAIGLRRRSPTGKFLFGSNAQRVLLDADCPVLAVKAPARCVSDRECRQR